MLLPEDYVVWDKDLSREDVNVVGKELAYLGELDKNKIDILPHIAVTANAFSFFLEKDSLATKITHLLGTLNHERHESVSQVSNHLQSIIKKSPIPEEIYKPVSRMLDNLGVNTFTIRAFYFDGKKLLTVKDFKDIEGDSVVLENVRHAWADIYSAENIKRYTIHNNNHHNLKCVLAIIPMLKFSLTGYVSHANKHEYEIEAHSMTRYRYNKNSNRLDSAFVLPGGDKHALDAREIKKLLDIAHVSERLFYLHQTIYWGKYQEKILATRIVPSFVDEKNSFNHLIDSLTIHPGITVGRLRVVNERLHEALEFDNEIIVLEKLDKRMLSSLKKVKGIILKEEPHPEVGQLLRGLGIPTVVRYDNKLLYSTGDVISLNAATGEVKRGSMLVS